VKRLLTALLAAAGVLVALALGGVLAETDRDARVAAQARPGDVVALLQERLERSPRDVRALAMLGAAYEQRARETGDPAYYSKAERVLERARSLAPDNLATTDGLGSLALSRHEFRQALRLGRRATSLAPTASRGYGVLGDALLELGRYDEAFRTFDRMSALKPGLDSYARAGHALDLVGETRAAERSLRLALEAARGRPEPEAWTHLHLGKLHFSRGRV
jgi:tetratricopeptide (TPR) repeat protein